MSDTCDRCGAGIIGRPRGRDKAFRVATEPRREWDILCDTCVNQVKTQPRPWINIVEEVSLERGEEGDVIIEAIQ